MINFLLLTLILSTILVGIHSYFGLRIIRRRIIFTDLAIGQMAALGTAVALCFFENENYHYWVSLLFALLGGILIHFFSKKLIYSEASIGLMYAFSVSAVFIVLAQSPHGMEEFQHLMASDIIFTPWEEVIKTGLLYSVLGVILFFSQTRLQGNLRDLLFFIIFAITVTSSVKIAGVLIVFALLIGPAYIALIINSHYHLWIAWGIGIILNLIAALISYYIDLPTGHTFVVCHALAALLSRSNRLIGRGKIALYHYYKPRYRYYRKKFRNS